MQKKKRKSRKKQYPPNLFDYRDYHSFLSDYFKYYKKQDPSFSYRSVSLRSGISFSSLQKVVERKRNISESAVDKYIKALRLSTKEAEYFTTLVKIETSFNYEEKVVSSIPSWHAPLIAAVAKLHDFRPDPAWISKKLQGIISTKEAKQALEYVIASGIITKKSSRRGKKSGIRLVEFKDVRSFEGKEVLIKEYKNLVKKIYKLSEQMALMQGDERVKVNHASYAIDSKTAERIFLELKTSERKIVMEDIAKQRKYKSKNKDVYSSFLFLCNLSAEK